MKYLILFLICFSANANFVKKSEIDSGSISKVFTRIKSCGSDCIKIPSGYNNNFHIMVDEMVDDITKPVNSKNEIESCVDQADCESKNDVKDCADNDEIVIMTEDFSEIYCSKLLRYEQKPSGRKSIVTDDDLKATFIANKKAKGDAMREKRDEIKGDILTKLNSNQALSQIEIKKLFLYLLGE